MGESLVIWVLEGHTWHLPISRREGKRWAATCLLRAKGCISLLPVLGYTVRPKLTVSIDTNVNSTILNLVDNVQSWRPGDTLVVASTDYSMYQAEEFQVLTCKACASTQVRVAGRHPTSAQAA